MSYACIYAHEKSYNFINFFPVSIMIASKIYNIVLKNGFKISTANNFFFCYINNNNNNNHDKHYNNNNNIYKHVCRVTISSTSPKELGYELNESNTINLLIVGERAELLANGTTVSKDLKYEQT